MGHFMRCLALAEAWAIAGGHVAFLTIADSSRLDQRLKVKGMDMIHLQVQPGSIEDARKTLDIAHNHNALWVVIDGYHFDEIYHKFLSRRNQQVLIIDDYGHADGYNGNMILNQNSYAHEKLYPKRSKNMRLLLGSDYVLLASCFLKWQKWQREIPKIAHKILVTMGGGETNQAVDKVLAALSKIDIPDLTIKVIAGAANSHIDRLKSFAIRSCLSIEILHDVTDMPKQMAWADMAITAGGTTCWEMAYMGLPNAIVVLADNQILLAKDLHARGISIDMGRVEVIDINTIAEMIHSLIKDDERRRSMSIQGRSLIKGLGSFHVVDIMRRKKGI